MTFEWTYIVLACCIQRCPQAMLDIARHCHALRDIVRVTRHTRALPLNHPSLSPNNLLYSPAYFGDVYAPVTAAPGRTNLRSATRGDLAISRTRTKLGERSFRISAPTVWNSLPDSLKHFATSREHFQKELKTYLFRKAYAPTSENY